MSRPVSPCAKFSKLLCLHLNNSITTRYHHNKTDTTNLIFLFHSNVDLRIPGSSGYFTSPVRPTRWNVHTWVVILFLLKTLRLSVLILEIIKDQTSKRKIKESRLPADLKTLKTEQIRVFPIFWSSDWTDDMFIQFNQRNYW